MNAFKIYLSDGDHYITSMNASLEEAKDYFAGHVNIEENFETGEETRCNVVKVEQI